MPSVQNKRTMNFEKITPSIFISVLIGISTLWILIIYSSFGTFWSGDSGGYVTPGCLILKVKDIYLYDGARTPVYPIMLGISQYLFSGKCVDNPNPSTVNFIALLQAFIYLGSFLFLFHSVKRYHIIIVVSVFLISLSPAPILFTRFILTESITISFINFFLGFVLRSNFKQEHNFYTLFSICFLSLAVLSRTNLLFPSIPLLIIILIQSNDLKKSIYYVTLLFVIPLILLSLFNFYNRGYFKIVNFEGFQMTHIIYNAFDRVKYKDRVIGGILNKQYLQDIKSGNETPMIVWRALPEIHNKLELMPFHKKDTTSARTSDLNEYLHKVSTDLIINNPDIVINNWIKSIKSFWDISPIEIPNISEDPRALDGGPNIRNQFIYRFFVKLQVIYNVHSKIAMAFLPFLFIIFFLIDYAKKIYLSILFYLAYLFNFIFVAIFNVIEPRYLIILQQILLISFYYTLFQFYSHLRFLNINWFSTIKRRL
jgi:hypothetical protein